MYTIVQVPEEKGIRSPGDEVRGSSETPDVSARN